MATKTRYVKSARSSTQMVHPATSFMLQFLLTEHACPVQAIKSQLMIPQGPVDDPMPIRSAFGMIASAESKIWTSVAHRPIRLICAYIRPTHDNIENVEGFLPGMKLFDQNHLKPLLEINSTMRSEGLASWRFPRRPGYTFKNCESKGSQHNHGQQ